MNNCAAAHEGGLRAFFDAINFNFRKCYSFSYSTLPIFLQSINYVISHTSIVLERGKEAVYALRRDLKAGWARHYKGFVIIEAGGQVLECLPLE
jgi:hypothetical protein